MHDQRCLKGVRHAVCIEEETIFFHDAHRAVLIAKKGRARSSSAAHAASGDTKHQPLRPRAASAAAYRGLRYRGWRSLRAIRRCREAGLHRHRRPATWSCPRRRHGVRGPSLVATVIPVRRSARSSRPARAAAGHDQHGHPGPGRLPADSQRGWPELTPSRCERASSSTTARTSMDAVVYNYNRWQNFPKATSRTTPLLPCGLRRLRVSSNVASVTAPDEQTVVITLKDPQSNFELASTLACSNREPDALKAGNADSTPLAKKVRPASSPGQDMVATGRSLRNGSRRPRDHRQEPEHWNPQRSAPCQSPSSIGDSTASCRPSSPEAWMRPSPISPRTSDGPGPG